MEMHWTRADLLRLARLAGVLALVATTWACYRHATIPGAEARRLRVLTTEPKVALRTADRTVVVDRASELTIKTVSGGEFALIPSMASYSSTAMKLGAATDPEAPVIPFDEVVNLRVPEFSIGRTLALVLPLAGGAIYLGVMFALLCSAGGGCF